MHTLTNHIIDAKKIKICYLENNSSNLRDIFNYCLQNTKINLKNICLELFAYLKYKNYVKIVTMREGFNWKILIKN